MADFYGWMTPSGRVVECEFYEHIKAATDDSEMRGIDGVGELLAYLEDIRKDCEALIESGEHPEWHRYDMASYGREPQIVQAIYRAGGLRVGTHGTSLCFEGTPEGIREHRQRCEDLAEGYGLTAEYEPQHLAPAKKD